MFSEARSNINAYIDFIQWIIKEFGKLIVDLLKIDYSSITAIDAITSTALALTGLFLAMECISYFSAMNMEGRIEDAIKFAIKVITAKIIIENSSVIISAVYAIFWGSGIDIISDGFDDVANTFGVLTDEFIDGNQLFLGIGNVLICMVLMLVAAAVVVMMMALAAQMVGIIFEVAIHQAVGPIAISTLCNSTARSTGISFIKSYTAVCLQITVIGVIFKIFSAVCDVLSPLDLTKSAAGAATAVNVADMGAFGCMFNYIKPLLMLIILTVSVSRSGELTKRMLGA